MLTEKINAFFENLGAEWVLWLLLALSVLSVFVMFERLIFYRRNNIDIDALSRELIGALKKGETDKAAKLLEGTPGMAGTVLRAAAEAYQHGVEDIEEVISTTLSRERVRYERNLTILGTLGNNAPFIGLFGTVIGIINAFTQLAGALEGSARTQAVMGSISEALVATAVGLAVAIPAVLAFNAFKTNIKKYAANVDWLARNALAYFRASNGQAKGEA